MEFRNRPLLPAWRTLKAVRFRYNFQRSLDQRESESSACGREANTPPGDPDE